VIGFAAQRTLGNLIAGFQIAITQPIRLDDVVVKIWDDRRLVLPISYFLENPFTNWTRRTAEILGTVHVREGLVSYLQQNYPTALPRFRAELSGDVLR